MGETPLRKEITRRVWQIQGIRKKDQQPFNALKFAGPNHADFILTPGQVHTVLTLGQDALRLIRSLPKRATTAKKE